ncbi:MAG: PIN domain-containing protein [Verrucomicrobiota bacterium]
MKKLMPAKHFFDTNILLYAYDREAGPKRSAALSLVEEAFAHPNQTSISVQVLQEFFVNFVRGGQSDEEAARVIDDFAIWHTIPNTLELFHAGLEAKARWQLSLWDAMIIAAAQQSGSTILYTEDLSHQQHYGPVQAINPFYE